MDSESKRDISEFNSAISYLNRLNQLLATSIEAAIDLEPYTWFHTLLALYRELSTEMKDNEIEKFETRIDILNKDISNWMVQKQRQITMPVPSTMYKSLHKFELDLRKIMKEAGLQQKIMDEAMKALK